VSTSGFDPEATIAKFAGLSEKDRLTIELVAQGYTEKNIASMTKKSLENVQGRIQRIYGHLGIRNRQQLDYVIALSKGRTQQIPIV
jgi:DNA-binding NarL/FixJ family response regulator